MPDDPREKLWHREARRIVEFYLETKGRAIRKHLSFEYPLSFMAEHKWKKFPGHTYDIMTEMEIIEIDDQDKHLKKSQLINDHMAQNYAERYLKDFAFYRLLKEEIVNRRGILQPSCLDYLRRNLF